MALEDIYTPLERAEGGEGGPVSTCVGNKRLAG